MTTFSEVRGTEASGMKILVTGATGFVGRRVCETLRARGIDATGAARMAGDGLVGVGEIGGHTDWSEALAGCTAVIHLAARVHVMNDSETDPLRAYREVNLHGSLALARQAAQAGVSRFVFVSSVKVNGESTTGQPFSERDEPRPLDPYGQSKMEAEAALRELARETGMEVVIVRPPLVYGPGVKANFLNLVKLVGTGLPLPFGRARGRRSMVALDNLVDLLILCTTHPAAAGETFMVSDGQDLTVGELAAMIASAMGKRAMLVPVPVTLMLGAARLLGKAAVADRLLGSLQVDIGRTRDCLGWRPAITPQAGIDQTVGHFLASKG
jgi:UDP-glucose 4-epimerase